MSNLWLSIQKHLSKIERSKCSCQLLVWKQNLESGRNQSNLSLSLSLHSVGYKGSHLSPLVCLLSDSLFFTGRFCCSICSWAEHSYPYLGIAFCIRSTAQQRMTGLFESLNLILRYITIDPAQVRYSPSSSQLGQGVGYTFLKQTCTDREIE